MLKIKQLGEFLGKLLQLLIKAAVGLIGNALKSLTKTALLPLGLTAAASAMAKLFTRTKFDLDRTALIFSNNELNDIPKVIKSLDDFRLINKMLLKLLKIKQNNKNEDF